MHTEKDCWKSAQALMPHLEFSPLYSFPHIYLIRSYPLIDKVLCRCFLLNYSYVFCILLYTSMPARLVLSGEKSDIFRVLLYGVLPRRDNAFDHKPVLCASSVFGC